MKRLAILFGLTLVPLCLLSVSSAAGRVDHRPGSFDASFGARGKVKYLGVASQSANSLALEPNGKILTVVDNAVVRLRPNGSKDRSFGHGGDASVAGLIPTAFVLDPKGRIVAAGSKDNGVELVRFSPNGTVDASYGDAGKVFLNLPIEFLVGMVRQSDGSILLSGSEETTDSWDFALVRVTAQGSLDSSFGNGGSVVTDIEGKKGNDFNSSMAVQDDGHIVLAGRGDGGFELAYYNSDGSLDTSVWGDGTTEENFEGAYGSDVGALAVTFQPAGDWQANGEDILIGGYAGETPFLARITAGGVLTGLLDSSFGQGGVAIPLQVHGAVYALAIDQSGRIIAAGTTGYDHLLVFRLTHKGALDKTFGASGKIVLTIPRADAIARAVKAQTDGRILVSGNLITYGDPGVEYLLMTRYMGGNACVVPAVQGKTVAGAKWTLRRRHCTIGRVARVHSASVKRGHIIRQHPGWGRRLPARAKVNLVVSKGKRR